jgi:hypothetical protein
MTPGCASARDVDDQVVMLTPGAYKLTHDLANPRPDRRTHQ